MTQTRTQARRRGAPLQARETADAQDYLRALFDRYEPGALIEVRSRYRDTMRPAFFKATDTFTAARTIVRDGLRSDVYVGVAARRRRAAARRPSRSYARCGSTSTSPPPTARWTPSPSRQQS